MDVTQNREPDGGVRGDQPRGLMEIIEYGEEAYRAFEIDLSDARQIRALTKVPENRVRWMNVDSGCDEAALSALGEAFHIHPLVIQNISNPNQRAKVEEYPGFLYVVAKMLYFRDGELTIEHMNFILGSDYVMTFGETKGDVFDDIRSHIAIKGSQLRANGADYLLYHMLNALVEGYFDVLESYKDKIDALEDRVMEQIAQEHLQEIRLLKREIIRVSRCIWPLRDVASLLGRETMPLIRPSTEPYLRDIYNHIVQAIDATETCRDLLSGLADLHLSNTSYKLNEVMKVLTIISTIFIPLTFVAGVYGMNFVHMPELSYRWGYAIVWGVMLVIAGCMVYYFKKKKWF
ncbi:MAG TPA: magnesium/cobalt transporter CorA [Clostridia bacterium]|nr:magnesium/cobalt transporter CorA [Clostridia bacterium]